jgi:chromosome partitioning protein
MDEPSATPHLSREWKVKRPTKQGAGGRSSKRRTRVIAVANQKGGVGKSTTAVSLGAALAELGQKVLVVDLDPQGNASTGLGIKHESRSVTIYDVLADEAPIADAVVATPLPNLFGVPSTIDLAGAEIELVSQFSRELKLRKALDPLVQDGFDFVFLDCPPSLGLLTINALAAAEELIVPIQCEYYALEGLGQLIKNVRLVQQNVNPSLRLSGIVMTMFDPRTRLSEQVVQEVRKYFGDRVYDAIIPRTVRLSEAPGFGLPITAYDPRSRGAAAYRELAAEVVRTWPSDTAIPTIEGLPPAIAPPAEAVRTAPHPLRQAEEPAGWAEPAGEAEPVVAPDGRAQGDEEGVSTEGREGDEAIPSSLSPEEAPSHVEAEPALDGESFMADVRAEPARETGAMKRRVVVVAEDDDDGDGDEGGSQGDRDAADRGEEGPKRRWSLFRRGGK